MKNYDEKYEEYQQSLSPGGPPVGSDRATQDAVAKYSGYVGWLLGKIELLEYGDLSARECQFSGCGKTANCAQLKNYKWEWFCMDHWKVS